MNRLALAFSALLPLLAHSAFAGTPTECGDVNADGEVQTTDALAVLRKAVGLPVSMTCEMTEVPTTSSTVPITGDCFSDSDCEFEEGRTHCCANECAECENESHCSDGESCSSGCECVPKS